MFTLPERHVKDNRGAFENSKSRKSSEQSLSFDLRQCLNTVSYVYRRAAEKSIICTSEINAAHLYSLWASFPRNTGRQMCSTFFWLCVHTRLCCLMEQMTTVAGGSANRPGMARPVCCYMIKVPTKAQRLLSVLLRCFLQQTASAMPCKQQSLCRAAARSASSVSLLLTRSSAGPSSNFKRAELQMTI